MQAGGITLLLPTGEQAERYLLWALDAAGPQRSAWDEVIFQMLCDKHGHPGVSFDLLVERDEIAIRVHNGDATEEELARAEEIDGTYRLKGADLTEDQAAEAAERQSNGQELPMAHRIALHNRRRS